SHVVATGPPSAQRGVALLDELAAAPEIHTELKHRSPRPLILIPTHTSSRCDCEPHQRLVDPRDLPEIEKRRPMPDARVLQRVALAGRTDRQIAHLRTGSPTHHEDAGRDSLCERRHEPRERFLLARDQCDGVAWTWLSSSLVANWRAD